MNGLNYKMYRLGAEMERPDLKDLKKLPWQLDKPRTQKSEIWLDIHDKTRPLIEMAMDKKNKNREYYAHTLCSLEFALIEEKNIDFYRYLPNSALGFGLELVTIGFFCLKEL